MKSRLIILGVVILLLTFYLLSDNQPFEHSDDRGRSDRSSADIFKKSNTNNQENHPHRSRHSSESNESLESLILKWDSVIASGIQGREKQLKLCPLLETMVMAGYYDEAKARALENDEGVLRQALVHSLFTKTEDLNVAMSQIKDPDFTALDYEAAWGGILNGLSSQEGSLNALQYLESTFISDDFDRERLLDGIMAHMDPSVLTMCYYDDPARAGDLTVLALEERERRLAVVSKNMEKLMESRTELRSEAAFRLIYNVGISVPNESVKLIEQYHTEIDRGKLGPIAAGVIENKFYDSPIDALSTVQEFEGKFNSNLSPVIARGIKDWMETDSQEALNWIATDGSGLYPAPFDIVSSSAAKYLLQEGRIEEATSLAQAMINPKSREDALKLIRDKESELADKR